MRVAALKMATKHAGFDERPDKIVTRATAFLSFIKGDTGTDALVTTREYAAQVPARTPRAKRPSELRRALPAPVAPTVPAKRGRGRPPKHLTA